MLDAVADGHSPPDGWLTDGSLADIVPLAAELGDLKRIRDASCPESLANRMFRRAWGALVARQPAQQVAFTATADAMAAIRLGGIDAGVLQTAGLDLSEAATVLARGFDEVAGVVPPPLRTQLRASLGGVMQYGVAPDFAERLVRQPRAGATCPGKPRIVLEPPEQHGDHCFVVAVLGCALAPRFGADPVVAFLAGMAHHLHNAVLPDSGFAGEILLGDQLDGVIARLFARELATLDQPLRATVSAALATIPDAGTPGGRAFHAADVLDRVLQMRHYHRVAAFTVDQALDDMALVHAGPVQEFHMRVLRDAGLP